MECRIIAEAIGKESRPSPGTITAAGARGCGVAGTAMSTKGTLCPLL